MIGGRQAPGKAAKTPDAIADKIAAELGAALKLPSLIADIESIGATPYASNSPAEFDRFIRADIAKWPAVLSRAGIEKS